MTRGVLPKGTVQQGQQLGPDFVMERGEPWLTLVGLCAIMDPPRPECVAAISEAHGAGVRVAMITVSSEDDLRTDIFDWFAQTAVFYSIFRGTTRILPWPLEECWVLSTSNTRKLLRVRRWTP